MAGVNPSPVTTGTVSLSGTFGTNIGLCVERTTNKIESTTHYQLFEHGGVIVEVPNRRHVGISTNH
jgi:hypothetical protein